MVAASPSICRSMISTYFDFSLSICINQVCAFPGSKHGKPWPWIPVAGRGMFYIGGQNDGICRGCAQQGEIYLKGWWEDCRMTGGCLEDSRIVVTDMFMPTSLHLRSSKSIQMQEMFIYRSRFTHRRYLTRENRIWTEQGRDGHIHCFSTGSWPSTLYLYYRHSLHCATCASSLSCHLNDMLQRSEGAISRNP